ncbi:hypothetical protein Tco_0823006 [Tanacetum coccineum]|uniref:Uncharacterized protein n=1 Tax=Tanacetum coccineum TaxID=301880 RepID=A0ABQ5AJN8_9ASTR
MVIDKAKDQESFNIPEREAPAGFADEVIYSLFAKQSEDLDLLHEELEQIDDVDIEEMDINWQIAMIAIRMKKFYKTGRRVRINGKAPVGFDKKKLEYQEARKQEQNQIGLLTMDDGVVNWGDHTVEEETNHALMAISSNSEANAIYEKDEKLKKYRRIGMKAIKEKEQLQKTVDSWKDSSKNLWRLVNSGMSSSCKIGLEYEITSNNEGPQKPETNILDDKSSAYSTCQSNDSEGSIGNSSKRTVVFESETISVPKEMSESKPVTTNEKVMKNWNEMMEREQGGGYSFTKKKCCVCGSLSHLIKDCDYHEKKMAREAELKKQRVFITGNGVANQYGLMQTGTNVNSVRPRVNTGSSNVNTVRSRQPVPTRTSNSFSPKRPQDHPLKNMGDRGGSVTFGGGKCYITGKGRIKVGNLEFDSVSFVKELGHFNLFSISQIFDKQHKVLFTETECLVVTPDFKMPDENQILLKVPRQHNMYSFDMKTPGPAKSFTCLIAKATSDESKLLKTAKKLKFDD